MYAWAPQAALVVINSANAERHGFNSWVGKIPWRSVWQPTLVFFPRESMDRRAWWAMVHRFTKSWTRLRQFSRHTSVTGEGNWQPTPVFLPGESRGQGSLVGCCLWGRTESDTTEVT